MESKIAKIAKTGNTKLPESIAKKPILHKHLLLYFQAFFDLINDRPIGMVAGYIPLTSMMEYCRY